MFSIHVNIDGLDHKLDLASEHANKIDEPLKKFGQYLKAKATARLKGGNFAPLSTGTTHARVLKGLARVESKLNIELKKAKKRAAMKFGEGVVSKGVTSRLSTLSAFQSRNRRGGAPIAGAQKLSLKQSQSLTNRTQRAIKKAVSKQILGRISEVLEVIVGDGGVTLESKTTKRWTDIHNKGGTAGHGSKIPQREYLKIEEEDLAILEGLLKEHILEPLV